MTIAYSPDMGRLHKALFVRPARVLMFEGRKFNNSGHVMRGCSSHLQKRVPLILALAIIPVALIGISLLFLLGYSVLGYILLSYLLHRRQVSRDKDCIAGYYAFSQLKLGWAEHGEPFYRQIWNHKCKDSSFCKYCEHRVDELKELLNSQQSIEAASVKPLDDSLFEASREFRRAVAEQQTDIMKEISDGIQSR